MANIWKEQKSANNQPKRNNFDLSFQNHLTMKMGTLYPVLCQEVVPGDSFRIDAAFGLKFMPLAFPVQSKMRATMHYFYVRNKNLWNRWEDWIQGLKTSADGVVHPYISQGADFFQTGKLADYLNVPTTYANGLTQRFPLEFNETHVVQSDISDSTKFEGYSYNSSDGVRAMQLGYNFGVLYQSQLPDPDSAYPLYRFYPDDVSDVLWDVAYSKMTSAMLQENYLKLNYFGVLPTTFDEVVIGLVASPVGTRDGVDGQQMLDSYGLFDVEDVTTDFNNPTSGVITVDLGLNFKNHWNSLINEGRACGIVIGINRSYDSTQSSSTLPTHSSFYFAPVGYIGVDVNYVNTHLTETPFTDDLLISALPFRAYESIYNAYYRNPVNQPFMVNGEVEYNRYNTTTEGGADETPYELKRRNYELDYLTSALPSPQQGNAPLVGMSALGTITLEDEDGITTAKAVLDNDGNITGVNVTSPIASKGHAITLAQIASAGFSINDFRNTNALQRWLETNIRKGYRYLDFIAGHTGVTPEYRELDMPEFLGGFTENVTVSSIVSTADTLSGNSGSGLGEYKGMANCFGGSQSSITHFCDDYGFIIGILCVVPTPAYSQLLPKHFLKYSPLDYHFDEFNELGMQPITYEEVCPIQAWYEALSDESKHLTDTFGYQRPYYDMVSRVDEIHGQFRGDLRNFLINRVFQSRPVLGNDFLQIDPEETNQIFADVSAEADNIIGQIVFKIDAKRPLPRVVIPALGR